MLDILFILLSCSLINGVASFTIPKSKLIIRCDHFIATSTSLSQTSSDNGASLPFFAAPAFTTSPQSPQSSATTQSASQTATQTTVTTRLPLGTLFDGRDYIFITESNVRGYEWTQKETDVLLDDLMDAALGNLGGLGDDYEDTTGSASSSSDKSDKRDKREEISNSNNLLTITTDYELSQITLVPTSDWDSTTLGLGNRYDVYDGQQRLVTLNLLLAGLRNSFQSEANELLKVEERNKVNGYGFSVGGGKRAVALDATANEISNMLMGRVAPNYLIFSRQ